MISLEGNIGCGKSTALKQLQFSVRQEPVEAWTHLKQFYKDKSYTFLLQAQILASYGGTSEAIICERTGRSGLEVFANMLHEQGFMSELQMAILSAMFFECKCFDPKIIIYLHLPAHKCLERIKERGRESEENITLEYLEKIQEYYEKYLSSREEEGIIVKRIDAEGKTPEEIAIMITKIKDSYT